jgi:hypothetical protein
VGASCSLPSIINPYLHNQLRIANCVDLWSSRRVLRIANCELRIANCELRIANCELRIANCELRIANCELLNRRGRRRGLQALC